MTRDYEWWRLPYEVENPDWEHDEVISLAEAIAMVPEEHRSWDDSVFDDDYEPQAKAKQAKQAKGKGRRAARADRWVLLNLFVDAAQRHLSPTARSVWLTLFRDARGDTVRTGERDIAKRIGRGRRMVGMAIAELRSLGLLTVVHQGGLNRGATVYRISAQAQSIAP